MDDKTFDLTPLDQMAAHMNEMFNAFLRRGFTEKQALYLIGAAMVSGMEDESE